MFCRNCGSELKEGAKFCTKCGTKIEEVKVSDNTALNKKTEVKKSNKLLIIILIVVLVLAIIIGGITALLFIKPDVFDFVIDNSFVSGIFGDDNDDYYYDDEDDEDEDEDEDDVRDDKEEEKAKERIKNKLGWGSSNSKVAPAEETAPAEEAIEEAIEEVWERPNNYDFDDVFENDFDLYVQPFEQEHFDNWNIDIDGEVYDVILPQIDEYEKNLGRYKKTNLAGGDIVAYTINGTPVKIIVKSGYNGWNVERVYYGVADFYTTLSADSNYAELFYSEGRLCRVVDTWGNTFDYNCYEWEEINELGVIASKDRADVCEFVKNNVK